ncbi:MAG: diaminopimelate decarboxylase [Terriglobales bacterium]
MYRKRVLHCERLAIPQLVKRHGTPLYVYSATTIRERYQAFDAAFTTVPHTVCYSVKANPNLALLRLLANCGCGFDVVSGGELQRVIAAQRTAARHVVFSGVGKTADEIDAALRAGILMFNVESESELRTLAAHASALRKKARVALRVNPDVSADTHPYISTGLHQHKFGVPLDTARRLYAVAARQKWLEVAGVSAHIGSQILDVSPFCEAVSRLADLVRELRAQGLEIRYLDAGGGLGTPYHASPTPEPFAKRVQAYAQAIISGLGGLDVHLLLEPGRAIIGPAGALIGRVLYRKQNDGKRFVVVDAAMNDLIRPSLYGAFHEIYPVKQSNAAGRAFDVVGPICETGDFFARDRDLPELAEGELIAILDAGAYGMSLSSNYNSRPRAAEVLVEERNAQLIRRRETFADLIRPEQ